MKEFFNKVKRIFSFMNHNDYLLVLLVFFGILGAIFSTTPIRKGDATEYIMQTETMFFDKGLKFTDEVYKRHLSLKPGSMDGVGYVKNLGRDGNHYLTQHPAYYSFFSVPLYGLFYVVNPRLAYLSFFVTNLFFVLAVVFYLVYYLKKIIKAKNYQLLALSYIFFSTVFVYIFWHHPETFLFFTVSSFFFFLYVLKKPVAASFFLGLSIGQSLVLVFLGLNLIYFVVTNFKNVKNFLVNSISSAFAILSVASIHYLLSFYLTGNAFSLQSNAAFSLKTMKDVLPALFDPSVGLFWFYPMAIFSIVYAKKDLKTLTVLFSVFLSLLFFMINKQFYTHQVGLRYLNYLYPAFFFILDPRLLEKKKTLAGAMIGLSLFLTLGINIDVRLSNDTMDVSRKNFVGYKLIKKFASGWYYEHPAVFMNHSASLTDYIGDPKQHNPEKLKVFIDSPSEYLADNKYIVGNAWVRMLFTPIKPGTFEITFEKPNKRVWIKLNNKEYEVSNGIFTVNLSDKDIGQSLKEDMYINFSNYLYLDLMAEGWCACETNGNDQRTLGNSISQIKNNGVVVYDKSIDK